MRALLALALLAAGTAQAWAVDSIGRYRILREASHINGRVIFAARNPVSMGPVFIKAAVEREMGKAAYAEAAASFANEAGAAAILKGIPGVLQVYETGKADGMAWVAIEGVTGRELGGLLDGKHPDAKKAVRIMAAVLRKASVARAPEGRRP